MNIFVPFFTPLSGLCQKYIVDQRALFFVENDTVSILLRKVLKTNHPLCPPHQPDNPGEANLLSPPNSWFCGQDGVTGYQHPASRAT